MANSRWLGFLILGILLSIPFAGGFWLLDLSDRHAWREESARRFATVQGLVSKFERLSRPSDYYQDRLLRLRRALVRGDDPRSVLPAETAGPLSVSFFSGSGQRLDLPGFPRDFVAASKRCHALVVESRRGKAVRLSKRDRNLADSFLGTYSAIQVLAENPGKLQTLEPYGIDRSVGLFPYRTRNGARGSFIALLEHREIPREVLRRKARERLQRLVGHSFLLGTGDLDGSDIPPEIGRHLDSNQGRSQFVAGGRLWSYAVIDRRFLLFCSAPDVPPLSRFVERHPWLMFGVLLLFAACLLAGSALERRGIPIRLRVGFLFSVSTLGCIAVALGLGTLAVDAQRQSLIRERFDQATAMLEKADSSYAAFLAGMERRYARMVARIPPGDLTRVQRAIASLGGMEKDLSVAVIATSGEILFYHESSADVLVERLMGEEFRVTIGAMGRLLLGYEDTSRKAGVIARHAFGVMTGNSGRIFTASFGKQDLTWYFDYIRNPGESPVGVALISQNHGYLENLFLRNLLPKPRVPSPLHPFSYRFFPVSAAGEIALLSWTAKLPAGVIREMRDELVQTRAPVMRLVTIGRRPFLLAAAPSLHLAEQRLFLISPISDIEHDTRSLSHGLVAFVLLVLLFAAGSGLAFIRTLLEPMGSLTGALRQLGASDLREDICLRTGDEFEIIGAGLHQTIEELRELAMARNIQENLLPAAPLTTPAFTCHGWVSSGSEIGGEIFDHQVVEGGTIAIWMAGAPGHSIGSALMLGMYKMAVRLLLAFSSRSLEELTAELRAAWRESLPVLEQGRLLLGLADPKTRVVSLVSRNGGTAYHLRGDGSSGRPEITEISFRSLTGGREETAVFAVAPGDRVVLFSSKEPGEQVLATLAGTWSLAVEEAGPRILSDVLSNLSRTGSGRTLTMLILEAARA